MLELANEALNAARGAARRTPTSASAAIVVRRSPRERQVTGVSDTESYGLGVRTLVNGCWGFAATSAMTAPARRRPRSKRWRCRKRRARGAEAASRARAR